MLTSQLMRKQWQPQRDGATGKYLYYLVQHDLRHPHQAQYSKVMARPAGGPAESCVRGELKARDTTIGRERSLLTVGTSTPLKAGIRVPRKYLGLSDRPTLVNSTPKRDIKPTQKGPLERYPQGEVPTQTTAKTMVQIQMENGVQIQVEAGGGQPLKT